MNVEQGGALIQGEFAEIKSELLTHSHKDSDFTWKHDNYLTLINLTSHSCFCMKWNLKKETSLQWRVHMITGCDIIFSFVTFEIIDHLGTKSEDKNNSIQTFCLSPTFMFITFLFALFQFQGQLCETFLKARFKSFRCSRWRFSRLWTPWSCFCEFKLFLLFHSLEVTLSD